MVNTRLQRLICLSCNHVIPTHLVLSHLKGTHQHSTRSLPTQERIDQILASLHTTILPGFPPFPGQDSTVEEYSGLKTVTGLLCHSCKHGCTTKASLRTHYHKHHPAIPLPDNPIMILMQHFSEMPENKSYFSVSPARTISKNPKVAAHIKQAREAYNSLGLRVPAEERDVRGVDPWLQTNRWHIHLDGYNCKVLSKVLDLPAAQEDFDNLQEAITHTFSDSKEIILGTSELIRCKLNTPNLQE